MPRELRGTQNVVRGKKSEDTQHKDNEGLSCVGLTRMGNLDTGQEDAC